MDQMIIDARTAKTALTCRPFTTIAAVENFLETLRVGDAKDVDALISPDGTALEVNRLSMLISKAKGDRIFQVKAKGSKAKLATVRRFL